MGVKDCWKNKMRCFKTLFLTVIVTTFSPTLSAENISVNLLPKHKTFVGFNKHNYNYVELLDNDGNLYVTYWEINEESLASFKRTIKQCRENIRDKSLFNISNHISDINIDSIKPSLFKDFNLCIRNKGYTHKSSDAFYPGNYQLSLYRSHSTTGEYMPVGASYSITGINTNYKRVLIDVNMCVDKANQKHKSDTYEVNSTYFSHVNIEPFAKYVESCLNESNYIIESKTNKQPNNTVKVVREKDTHMDQTNSSFGHLP